MERGLLKRGLRTEIELALSGEGTTGGAPGGSPEPSVVLLVKPRQLPRALVTDSRGVTVPKILDYVDLLSALDRSSVVSELEREPVRTLKIPALPQGAVLLDVVDRPSGASYVVSGATPAAEHLFVLEQDGESTTHALNLPPIAYRAAWDSRTRTLTQLSLALCSPDLQGEPTAETELYRWPFSNVYSTFQGVAEGVCWPTMGRITLDLSEIAEKGVSAFAAVPNDAAHYARDLSHNAPCAGYRPFLELVEREGGIRHEWLNPCAMNLKELHDQRRRES